MIGSVAPENKKCDVLSLSLAQPGLVASLMSICQGSFPLSPSLKDAEYQRHPFQQGGWSIFPNNVSVYITHPPCSFLRFPVLLRMACVHLKSSFPASPRSGMCQLWSVRKLLRHFHFLILSSGKIERG